MALEPYERIWHTLVYGGVRRTGLSDTLTLRIMRFDGYVYDWDDGKFKALDDETLTTPAKKPDAEHDATNDPGTYYWNMGSGSVVNGILPTPFVLDGQYRFEIDETTLGYSTGYVREIAGRREAARYGEEVLANDRRLLEGANENYVIYERDGETPLVTKNVRDKGGGSISLPAGVPARETTS